MLIHECSTLQIRINPGPDMKGANLKVHINKHFSLELFMVKSHIVRCIIIIEWISDIINQLIRTLHGIYMYVCLYGYMEIHMETFKCLMTDTNH